MKSNNLGKIAPKIVAIFTGIGFVFMNWYLVDPFGIRILPMIFRYGITVVAGALLGYLLFLSLRKKVGRSSHFKPGWDTLGVAVIGVILFILISLSLAPNRYSSTWFQIKIQDQPEPVTVGGIYINQIPLPQKECEKIGNWDSHEGNSVVPAGESATLTCLLVKPEDTPIKVSFIATKKPVTVEISLDDQVKEVTLVSSVETDEVLFQTTFPYKIAFSFLPIVRILDILFLLIIVYDFLISLFVLPKFNEWFEDNTPRFQWAALTLTVLSITASIALLCEPILSSLSYSPIINADREQPNILFIVADALTAEDMSLFGYSLPTTRALEKEAQDWSIYTNAQSPQTCSVGALASNMTGRYLYTYDYNSYGNLVKSNAGFINLSQTLLEGGYQTWWWGYLNPGFYRLGSGFSNTICPSSNPLKSAVIRSWFKPRAIMGMEFPYVPLSFDLTSSMEDGNPDFSPCYHLDGITNFFENDKPASPFYVYYHYRGVHGIPYPMGDHLGTFLPVENGLVTFEEQDMAYEAYPYTKQSLVDKLRLRYDEAVTEQTDKLANFIRSLKQKDWYDSTMIVIVADHGQNFSRGFSSHCTPLNSFAEAHVPLLIKYPHQKQGERVDSIVSILDVVPTVLDVAGFDYQPGWLDGISLIKQRENPGSNRLVFTRHLDYAGNTLKQIAVADNNYRLVKRPEGWFLYSYKSDPLEKTNLFLQNGYANLPEVKRLQKAIENYIEREKLILSGKSILNTPLVP